MTTHCEICNGERAEYAAKVRAMDDKAFRYEWKRICFSSGASEDWAIRESALETWWWQAELAAREIARRKESGS